MRTGTKKLLQMDEDGNILKKWGSIKEACIYYGITLSMISWSNKNNKIHKGFF